MEKSEEGVVPCFRCGGMEIAVCISEESELWSFCEQCHTGLPCVDPSVDGEDDDLDAYNVNSEDRRTGFGIWNAPIHPNRLKAEGLAQLPKGIPHQNCAYLGEDGEVCRNCGQLVDARMVPLAFANLLIEKEAYKAELEALLKIARLGRDWIFRATESGEEDEVNPSHEDLRVVDAALAHARAILGGRG